MHQVKRHGYPIAWNEVPPKLVNQRIRTERITRQEVRNLWGNEDLGQHLRDGSQ